MFNLFNADNNAQRNKRVEQVNRDIELYRRERILEVKEEMVDLRTRCAEDIADAEHNFHSGKEEKKVELAKLDADIANKKTQLTLLGANNAQEIASLKEIIKEKDSTISKLDELVKFLATKLPIVDLKNFNISCKQ